MEKCEWKWITSFVNSGCSQLIAGLPVSSVLIKLSMGKTLNSACFTIVSRVPLPALVYGAF